MKKLVIVAACVGLFSQAAPAAQGEMGTGVPHFGIYSAATGLQVIVWSMADIVRPFPAGCSTIVLTPTTMGLDSYKMAVATLTAARVSGMKVRFFSHAERDNGCGVDYVQLEN